MGSQTIQAALWSKGSKEWASIQEKTSLPLYDYVLTQLEPGVQDKLLDVGCGSGIFCGLAQAKGAAVTGLDATPALIEEAKKRAGSVEFLTGEIEELPFADNSFDIVTGFNSFQYAANVKNGLFEAKRVLKDKGKLLVMIWGNKEDCEAATYIKAVGSLLPPPPPGAPGPFALSENNLLENILQEIGLTIIDKNDVDCNWEYPNTEIALKGIMSAGPAAKAIDNSGFDKVYETLKEATMPYTKNDGRVIYQNKFRVVIAQK